MSGTPDSINAIGIVAVVHSLTEPEAEPEVGQVAARDPPPLTPGTTQRTINTPTGSVPTSRLSASQRELNATQRR